MTEEQIEKGYSKWLTETETTANRAEAFSAGVQWAILQAATRDAPSADAVDAQRYRWLKEKYFDWAAPGEGDSFDYIALHFEHDMLGRDESTVDAAIDADIAASAPKT